MYLSISRVSLFFSKLLRPETINLIDILDETLSLCLKIVPFFFLTELTKGKHLSFQFLFQSQCWALRLQFDCFSWLNCRLFYLGIICRMVNRLERKGIIHLYNVCWNCPLLYAITSSPRSKNLVANIVGTAPPLPAV